MLSLQTKIQAVLLIFIASTCMAQVKHTNNINKTNVNKIKLNNFNVFLLGTSYIEKATNQKKPKKALTKPFPKKITTTEKEEPKKTEESSIPLPYYLKQDKGNKVEKKETKKTEPAKKKPDKTITKKSTKAPDIILSEEQQLYQAAKKLYNTKNYAESENILLDLMQKYPDAKNKYDAAFHLGEIKFNMDDNEEAVMYYEKIINDFKKSKYVDDSYYRIALINYKQTNFSGALKYLGLMQEKFDHSSLIDESYILKGKIYNDMKEYKIAVENYETVIKEHPKSNSIDRAYYLLGLIYKEVPEIRDFEKAAELLKKVREKSTSYEDAQKELEFINKNFLKYK